MGSHRTPPLPTPGSPPDLAPAQKGGIAPAGYKQPGSHSLGLSKLFAPGSEPADPQTDREVVRRETD